MLVRGYFIRHLKRGVLTDMVYLTPPDEHLMVTVCGSEDVALGLVRLAETVVDLPEDLSVIESPPLPPSETAANPHYFKVVVAGAGSVKNPE